MLRVVVIVAVIVAGIILLAQVTEASVGVQQRQGDTCVPVELNTCLNCTDALGSSRLYRCTDGSTGPKCTELLNGCKSLCGCGYLGCSCTSYWSPAAVPCDQLDDCQFGIIPSETTVYQMAVSSTSGERISFEPISSRGSHSQAFLTPTTASVHGPGIFESLFYVGSDAMFVGSRNSTGAYKVDTSTFAGVIKCLLGETYTYDPFNWTLTNFPIPPPPLSHPSDDSDSVILPEAFLDVEVLVELSLFGSSVYSIGVSQNEAHVLCYYYYVTVNPTVFAESGLEILLPEASQSFSDFSFDYSDPSAPNLTFNRTFSSGSISVTTVECKPDTSFIDAVPTYVCDLIPRPDQVL